MSDTDPSVVQEIAEEVDAFVPEGTVAAVEERVDVAAPSVSFLEESEDSDSDPNIAHRRRLRKVKTIEKHLSAQEGLKWYEIAGSYLDHDRADIIRERSGMPAGFELAMPNAEDRAHEPPVGYHSFYLDQIDMGLRFPIPQTIQQFCRSYSISPSQLLPNSYAILLSLGVLIKYFGLKIRMGLLGKIVHVKRVGPGRFYVNPRPEYQFLGGHPSSHKGWPNRFFFVQTPLDHPWSCDMSWTDSLSRQPPTEYEFSQRETNFLATMSALCYRTTSLVKDDLLCHFGFCKKGVQIEGDIGRVGKYSLVLMSYDPSSHLLTFFL